MGIYFAKESRRIYIRFNYNQSHNTNQLKPLWNSERLFNDRGSFNLRWDLDCKGTVLLQSKNRVIICVSGFWRIIMEGFFFKIFRCKISINVLTMNALWWIWLQKNRPFAIKIGLIYCVSVYWGLFSYVLKHPILIAVVWGMIIE